MTAAKHEGTVGEVLAGDARFAVVCGDALETMDGIASASLDAVIMDPPYGVDIAEWDDDVPPQHWLDECLRVAGGAVLWFGAAVGVLKLARYSPPPARVLVWAPTFALTNSASHGMLYRWHSIAAWRPKSTGGRVHCDVLTHATEAKRNEWNHSCTKPVALMRDLVAAFVPDGGVVADFTAGSGTTGVAALLEGRRVILVERDPVHAATCLRRLRETEPRDGTRPAKQLKLFGAR